MSEPVIYYFTGVKQLYLNFYFYRSKAAVSVLLLLPESVFTQVPELLLEDRNVEQQ